MAKCELCGRTIKEGARRCPACHLKMLRNKDGYSLLLLRKRLRAALSVAKRVQETREERQAQCAGCPYNNKTQPCIWPEGLCKALKGEGK